MHDLGFVFAKRPKEKTYHICTKGRTKIGGKVMDTKSGKRSDRTNDWLLNEILDAQEKGVTVAVDGKSYGIQDIPNLCGVMEAHEYMKSYVCDRSGKIVHIDFDQIIGV